MPRLAGKIAWITGAGSGIGEAAALALANEGAVTVLTGRRREPLERVAARIHQQVGQPMCSRYLTDFEAGAEHRHIHPRHVRPT